MKKYFLITVSLLVTLAVLSGCIFGFSTQETTEQTTQEEQSTPATTETTAFSEEDVPDLPPTFSESGTKNTAESRFLTT